MNFIYKSSFWILIFFFSQNLFCQFEKISIKNTSIEYERDLLADTANHYLKIMLCGDLIHKNHLFKKYVPKVNESYSYRSWFRQVKPLFFYPDFVVGSLQTFFPNRSAMNAYENSAPDEFLGELAYTGFNVLMMANSKSLTDKPVLNSINLKKIDQTDIFHLGYYRDREEKEKDFPLILEKKDIRIAFLNYSLDSVLLDLAEENINFFQVDSIQSHVKKAKKTMMADFVIAYIDWAGQDSLKMGKVIELLNLGIDIVVGTGGESFTSADVMSFSDGSLKLHIDNIGHFNASSNQREKNKSAVIEVVLKKNKKSNQVSVHDMGFIPLWTLMDKERYAVLPISNVEEKHIQDINLNLIQYSTMKVALTDLRFAFFDKIPELHYDFSDKHVTTVEQTAFIRKTLAAEQDKINQSLIQKGIEDYVDVFGQEPPDIGSFVIPYEDDLNMYKSFKPTHLVEKLPERDSALAILESNQNAENKKLLTKLEIKKNQIYAEDNFNYGIVSDMKDKIDSFLENELRFLIISTEGNENYFKIESLRTQVDELIESNQIDEVLDLIVGLRDSSKSANAKNVSLQKITYDEKAMDDLDKTLLNFKSLHSKEIVKNNERKQLVIEIDSVSRLIKSYQARERAYLKQKSKKEDLSKPKASSQKDVSFKKKEINIYGDLDEISPRGILHIKSNRPNYTRMKETDEIREQKRVKDSIRKYNDRFMIKDSIAELKKEMKRRKVDSLKRRDSLFYASLNPNYKSSYVSVVQAPSNVKSYRPIIQSGVYTEVRPDGSDKQLPVKNIEEYFLVQIFEYKDLKQLDLDLYPYLQGYEIRQEENFYRYYIGKTKTQTMALAFCQSLISKGHTTAVVVKYTDGVRSIFKSNF